jgi:hypothetical protein
MVKVKNMLLIQNLRVMALKSRGEAALCTGNSPDTDYCPQQSCFSAILDDWTVLESKQEGRKCSISRMF